MRCFDVVNTYVRVMSLWMTEPKRCVVSVHPFLILHHIANVLTVGRGRKGFSLNREGKIPIAALSRICLRVLWQFFYPCKEFLIIHVLAYVIHNLFFNLSNKQAVLLLLRLGVCKPYCHLS